MPGMQRAIGRRTRGFSLLELCLVVAVWAVLVGVLLERLTYYQEAAEHARFESELQQFKTGLQLRMAELISANREAEVRQLESENPVRWLGKAPASYAGEYPDRPEAGNWYFDSLARELVYVPNQDRFLTVEGGRAPVQLRFRVRIRHQPVHAPGGGGTWSGGNSAGGGVVISVAVTEIFGGRISYFLYYQAHAHRFS